MRQCGGRRRATRPPSWSISTGASARATAGAQILDQPARALGRVDIAGEQNEAQRIGVTEEGAFVGREIGPGAAEDRRARATHGRDLTALNLNVPAEP